MTLSIERAQTRRPISWLTLLGVLLLPAVIGGLLVAALYNPTERLDALNTAIVNNDEPVEVNGQTTPLGRLLTAGLVEGSKDLESNLTWTISNSTDAKEGLEDGTYDAIVTIPKNFSAAATSTAPGKTPERATIELTSSPDARIVDDAITTQVTSTAASVLGQQLTTGYLENVFLGFTTLNEQLGKAADGATQLADGAKGAADGASKLADGASSAADGGYSLADGLRKLQNGANQLAGGAAATSKGLSEWSAGARPIADGTQQLADGLTQAAEQTSAIPAIPSDVVEGLKALTADGEQNREAVTGIVDTLTAAANACDPAQAGAELCDQLTDAAADATSALPTLQATVGDSKKLAENIDALANFGPSLTEGLRTSAAAAEKLAGGMGKLADGAEQLSSGAGQLSTGARDLATGAGAAAEGGDKLAAGVDALAGGAGELSTGVGKLADGTDDLAGGLDKAVDGVPSYTKNEAKDLASIVADPVVADGTGSSLFGASAVPLLATLALWFGGLASFVVLRAVPRTALSSRRSSAALALRALAPGVVIGALQGALVAVVVQLAAGYDADRWWLFAAMCVLAGVAFAAVNHALVALFGGIGRWISVLVGVMALATGIVSTVPGALLDVAGLLPTAPAYTSMLAALTDAGGGATAAVGLVLWTVLAIGAGILAVARHRSTSARAVLTQPA